MILPTGGAFEYDYAGAVNAQGHSVIGLMVYRRVIEKRVYSDGQGLASGGILEGKMTYSIPALGNTIVTMNHLSGGTTLASDKHYLYGGATDSQAYNPFSDLLWNEGKEYQIEALDTDATGNVLRRIAHTWQIAAIPGGPRITDTTTTLLDTGRDQFNNPNPTKVAKQHFDYDQYNNTTDVYEYNFGLDAPGSLLRRTHTSYVNSAVYTGTDVHLRSLPLQQWVSSDANGANKLSLTDYEYDNYTAEQVDPRYHAALVARTGIFGLCTRFDAGGNCTANDDPTTYTTRGNVTKTSRWIDTGGTADTYNQYDIAGNIVKSFDPRGNAPTTPANGIVYDAENRQTSYTKAGATTSYSYDGDGRRVKRIAGSVTTIFVYNVAGQLIAEYDNSTSPPPAGGTSYLTSDHLGSTRVVTRQDGTVNARYDYLPFGEEIGSSMGSRSSVTGYGGADLTRQKFTQKERDSESGLDYFLARYYSSAQGRFTSPDEFTGGPHEVFDTGELLPPDPLLYAEPTEPQSFNKYQYCLNNPLRYVDPDGHQTAVADALKQTGQGLQSTGNPYLVSAGRILIGVTAAVLILKDVDWEEVAQDVGKSGAATGCLAGVDCTGHGQSLPQKADLPNGQESTENDGIDQAGESNHEDPTIRQLGKQRQREGSNTGTLQRR